VQKYDKQLVKVNTGDARRDKMADTFMQVFLTPIPDAPLPYDDHDFQIGLCNIGIQIEKGIFDLHNRFSKITDEYFSKARSLLFNLKDKSNEELKLRLIN